MSFLRGSLAHDGDALPPEIAFLAAEGVDPRLLARAAGLARAADTDAATALINAKLMPEEAYYRGLARALGTPYLDGPIAFGSGVAYPGCLTVGLAPLTLGAVAPSVLAPRGASIAELLAGYSRTGMPAITSPGHLREAVYAAMPAEVADHAAEALRRQAPDWAVPREPASRWLLLLALLSASGIALFAALPPPLALAATLALQCLFLAMTVFRVAALAIPVRIDDPGVPPLPDAELPVYTILVPLHREARIVPRLADALAALDYPAAKLDLKVLIEADDAETAAALADVRIPGGFEVVTVPPGAPRTKPRALNAALPLARGSLLAVYDAEDVPDPGQLRLAAALFARLGPSTACLQGRLVIDNPGDAWFSRMFALEYAGLFDVLNPALTRLDLPVALGGTSMHLRTEVVRALHGWDAWNVTEDADLGIRLALAGYAVGDLPSATIEEAPTRLRAWLAQRTRWMKGFMQTSLTHGRRPLANGRRLGALGSLCAAAMVPGTVVSALAYPILMGHAAWAFMAREIPASPAYGENLTMGLAMTLFGTGLAALTLPAYVGCRRRAWHDLVWSVPWLPVYFMFVSLAAWLALVELVRAPARWNKTEHGLAHTSRSGRLFLGAGRPPAAPAREDTWRPSRS